RCSPVLCPQRLCIELWLLREPGNRCRNPSLLCAKIFPDCAALLPDSGNLSHSVLDPRCRRGSFSDLFFGQFYFQFGTLTLRKLRPGGMVDWRGDAVLCRLSLYHDVDHKRVARWFILWWFGLVRRTLGIWIPRGVGANSLVCHVLTRCSYPLLRGWNSGLFSMVPGTVVSPVAPDGHRRIADRNCRTHNLCIPTAGSLRPNARMGSFPRGHGHGLGIGLGSTRAWHELSAIRAQAASLDSRSWRGQLQPLLVAPVYYRTSHSFWRL